jgi:hypothetical protein
MYDLPSGAAFVLENPPSFKNVTIQRRFNKCPGFVVKKGVNLIVCCF